MISGGTGSRVRSNEMARFCATVIASSSTMRSLTMPKRSTKASHSSLSAMALVGRPRLDDLALVGQRRAGNQVDEDLGGRAIEPERAS